jgi:hypothetical protein
MFTLSIDVTKIDKSLLKEVTKQDGTKAIYLNLICWENEDGKDKYDNDGTIKQSLSKEQREAGIKSKIIGNYKVKGDAPAPAPKVERVVHPASTESDDIPF